MRFLDQQKELPPAAIELTAEEAYLIADWWRQHTISGVVIPEEIHRGFKTCFELSKMLAERY